jgi:hypothetical protein
MISSTMSLDDCHLHNQRAEEATPELSLIPMSPSTSTQLAAPATHNTTATSKQIIPHDHPFSPPLLSFLDWATFTDFPLPPRKNPRRSRLERFLSPLRTVNAGAGPINVEGIGSIIESAHGLFHSVRRLDFMESERTLSLMIPLPLKNDDDDHSHPHPHLQPRDLERYENELFDLSKYLGGTSVYLTAATWTEEARAGSLTLYRVILDEEEGIDSSPSSPADSIRSSISDGGGGRGGRGVIAVRPVALMRDVPSSVLGRMRADERVCRKAVLTLIDEDDRTFDWRANTFRGRPRYVWLPDDNRQDARSWARADSRARSRSISRQRHSSPASRDRRRHGGGERRLADGNAVRATIPQFIALLHATRAVLECVKSDEVREMRLEDGSVRPVVRLEAMPRSSPHVGNAIHVAVLAPNDAEWAEEEFVWTDRTGMAELRQRAFWDVIKPAGPRANRRDGIRGRSISRMGRDGQGQRLVPRLKRSDARYIDH